MKPADLAIPKVIHQTWKSAELEQPFKSFQASWRLHHPEWEYRFWTDQDLDVLVQTHAPGLLQLYRDYPDPICRIDLARYLILHVHGGLYCDIDFECFQNVERLLDEAAFVIGLEPDSHASGNPKFSERGLSRVLSPAWMASTPGHPFMRQALDALPGTATQVDVLDRTGPFFLTRVFQEFTAQESIRLVSADLLHPFSSEACWDGIATDFLLWDEARASAVAAHHWAGTWFRTSPRADHLRVPRRLDVRIGRPGHWSLQPVDISAELGSQHQPVISCLMVTRDRFEQARTAIACWQTQTWPAKEMVIVDDGDDNRLAEWIASTGDPDIRIIRLPDDGRTLGALRNIAVQKSRGTLVCQWDDDDLYHPLRLEIQCRALLATQSDACFLSMWMMWWPHAGRFAVSGIHSWEGSVLAKKSKLPAYPELRRGEDTPAIRKLIANSKVIHLDQPSLYLYCVHGKNTWDNRHFESMWNEAVRHYEGRDAAAIKLKLQQMYPVLNDDFVYPASQHRAKVSAWERLKRRFARLP